ncbi:MAG: sugar phosphate isomerase/epimerase [Chthoniobacter sp.]|uniref:sugar phosphate isomerase/epimerase family protein n=1 Tax=Chthoniobacter sp. TaxID=2510640 RepID=UPI0032A21B44
MKCFLLPLLAIATTASAIDLQGDFKGPLGLQLYSLRETFKKDPTAALDKTKALGFHYAEVYAGIPLPPDKLKEELAARGITAIGSHFGYDDLKKDLPAAVAKAKAWGLKYAGVAWIPHTTAEFGEADVKKAAADFNTFGEAFKAEGIQFFYHTHGYEFRPVSEGSSDTFFDMLVKETKPDLVSYEMDVFWTFLPGVDPVKLLAKYPDRWALMHLKDMRKGAVRGVFTGKAPLTDDVPIGTGQIDWPAVLKQAAKSGVKYYFIEDESPTVEEALPQSIKYLETVK